MAPISRSRAINSLCIISELYDRIMYLRILLSSFCVRLVVVVIHIVANAFVLAMLQFLDWCGVLVFSSFFVNRVCMQGGNVHSCFVLSFVTDLFLVQFGKVSVMGIIFPRQRFRSSHNSFDDRAITPETHP